MSENTSHTTVLLQEAVDALDIKPDGFYVDGTFGRGGHSQLILARLGDKGRLLALDQDQTAVEFGRAMTQDIRFELLHEKFSRLPSILKDKKIDGVLLDLGVSSPQLEEAERGFSFMRDGPLDMRMDQSSGISAADWINSAEESEIADVLWRYGEERKSRWIAKEIIKRRAEKLLMTTFDLAKCISDVLPKYEKKHPATRSFQAIRIFINQELSEVKDLLNQIIDFMKIGARLVVISFHSLEDRLVKQVINQESTPTYVPPEIPIQPETFCRLKKIVRHIRPNEKEIAQNVRSRSAIMRIAERIA